MSRLPSAYRAMTRLFMCGAMIMPAILSTNSRGCGQSDPDSAILRNHHIEPTLAGVTTYFESLRSLETRRSWQDALVADLIAELDHDDWAVRDASTGTLATMPIRARPKLTDALNADDLEIVWRARRVLDRIRGMRDEAAHDQGRIIQTVCRVIKRQSIRGTAPVLVDAMKHIRQKYVLGSVRRALAATAGPDDADLLRRSMGSDYMEIKVAAILALGSALGAEGREHLRPLLGDRNPLVRAAAAHALAGLGDRAVLPVLVELLSVDRVRVRSESIRVLRALTGLHFGYAAYDELADQQAAIGKWRQWVETEAAAPLTLPLEPEAAVFEAFLGTVEVYSHGGNRHPNTHFIVNGRRWGGEDDFSDSRGITVMAIHRDRTLLLKTYDTYRSTEEADAFADAIASLPTGCFVMLGVNDEATVNFNANGQRAIESIGAAVNLRGEPSEGSPYPHFRTAYLCIGYKGLAPGYAVEKLAFGRGPVRHLPR